MTAQVQDKQKVKTATETLAQKKKVWAILVKKLINDDGTMDEKKFIVLARTVNAGFSKANKYKKDHNLSDYDIYSIECTDVVDY